MKQTGDTARRWAKYCALLALLLTFALLAQSASYPVSGAAVRGGQPSGGKSAETADEMEETGLDGSVEPIVPSIVVEDVQVLTTPSPTSFTTVLTTNPPGVWTYENSRIEVEITQHKKDDYVYFAADIKIVDPLQLVTAFSHEQYGGSDESVSDIAQRHGPLLAINGDYYGFHDVGVIIRNGELYRNTRSERQLLAVEANGDLTVLLDRTKGQQAEANEMMQRGVLHTFEFGPILVQDSKAIPLQSDITAVQAGYLEPRTAIGQLGPLHYLVIVVDGRSDGYSAGCDLPALQQLFVEHGAVTAFNLDGGGSTTLWFDGNVINRPSSGEERKVSDVVMFMY